MITCYPVISGYIPPNTKDIYYTSEIMNETKYNTNIYSRVIYFYKNFYNRIIISKKLINNYIN